MKTTKFETFKCDCCCKAEFCKKPEPRKENLVCECKRIKEDKKECSCEKNKPACESFCFRCDKFEKKYGGNKREHYPYQYPFPCPCPFPYPCPCAFGCQEREYDCNACHDMNAYEDDHCCQDTCGCQNGIEWDEKDGGCPEQADFEEDWN